MSNDAIFAGLVTLGIFLLVNLGSSIWWMARISTLVETIQRDIKKNVEDYKEIRELVDETRSRMHKLEVMYFKEKGVS